MANEFAGLKLTPEETESAFAGLKLTPEEMGLPPEPEQVSAGETFAQNAINVFGAGPALVGAVNYVTRGQNYEAARNAYAERAAAGKEQNPRAALAGAVTSIVPETILGGAAGKVVSGGAKAIGLAEGLAPIAKANPVISSVLESGLAGAGYGAAAGAGEALSKGEDITPSAGRGALGGAIVGGALGTVVGGIKKAARGAIERADNALVPGVTDAVSGAERHEVITALRAEPELRKLASKPAAEAINGLTERASGLAGKADELIAQIEHKAGGMPIGKFVAAIDKEIAELGKTPLREQYAKALNVVKESALKSWLPEDLSSALSSNEAKESELLTRNLLKRRNAAPVSLARLEELSRDVSTNLPGAPEVKAHVADVLRSVRDAHLTDAIAKNPEIKSAADALRDLDSDMRVIQAITGALKGRPAGDHGGLEKLVSLFTHHGPIGAGIALASGHPIPAAILAAPAIARKGTEILALLQREAAAGNVKAIRILKAADAARDVGTAAAGAVGSAKSGTIASLAEGNQAP